MIDWKLTETIQGFTLGEWRAMPWWPEGRAARVYPGMTGHDREIVVNIDGYGSGKDEEHIPGSFLDVLRHVAPSRWKMENRSTRIEVHPTGRLFGGYTATDVDLLMEALRRAGMGSIEVIEWGDGDG